MSILFLRSLKRTMYNTIVDLFVCGENTSISEAFHKVSSSGFSKVVRMLATVLDIAAAKFSYIHVTSTNSSCTCS